jgi:hypothetical protein
MATTAITTLQSTTLNGVTGSTMTIGNNLTTDSIQIGTASTSNTITIGSASATNQVNVGGVLVGTNSINGGTGGTNFQLYHTTTTGSISLGDAQTSGVMNIGTGVRTTAGQINIGTGSGAVAVPINIGGTGSVTTNNGTLTSTGLITANGGLTMGGSTNITLGSGASAPTTGQLGNTVSTTGVNLYNSTGYSKAICNATFNCFSANSGQGILLTPGSWMITYTIQCTTDSATLNWVYLFNTYLVSNTTTSNYGTFAGAQVFISFNQAANYGFPLNNNGNNRPCGSGTLLVSITANTYYNVQAYISTVAAQSGNLVLQNGNLTAARIA